MPFRLSERTSNSRALSTICRFVLRRVSFFALRTKLSLNVNVRSHRMIIHHSWIFLCITLRRSTARDLTLPYCYCGSDDRFWPSKTLPITAPDAVLVRNELKGIGGSH